MPLDWNHDFRTDLALCGSGGVSLLLQNEDGTFADVTARAYTGTFPTYDCVGAWPADVEMDGDLDLVVGVREGAPIVLRNNGNGTWQVQQPFAGTFNVRVFAWADLDRDADPDAVFVDALRSPAHLHQSSEWHVRACCGSCWTGERRGGGRR